MTEPRFHKELGGPAELQGGSGCFHLVGVGGIGMSALALMLADMGISLSGCDKTFSRATELVARRGIPVWTGHSLSHLQQASALIYSSAVPAHHAELVEARKRGIACYRRADFLGHLLQSKRVVAVAGTHGKTTTTAMVAYILYRAGVDPWWMIGGIPRDLPAHGRAGQGELAAVEADEYDASFLTLKPALAVVTTVEPEHLDFFTTYDRVLEAFRSFLGNSDRSLICLEDAGAASLVQSLAKERVQTYGFERGDWRAFLQGRWHGGMAFAVEGPEFERAEVKLRLWGRHNVLNAVAAMAATSAVGIDVAKSAAFLEDFTGVERRLQLVGTWNGIPVYDDYGHHPTEIAATREAMRAMLPGHRIAVVFQPHTYSRTRTLLHEFANELAKFDVAVVTEVYRAREEAVEPISGEALASQVPAAQFARDRAQAKEALMALRSRIDVVLTLGAGDVWKLAWELVHGNENG